MCMHCVCDNMHPYMRVHIMKIACEVYVVCYSSLDGHSVKIYGAERIDALLLLVVIRILAMETYGNY